MVDGRPCSLHHRGVFMGTSLPVDTPATLLQAPAAHLPWPPHLGCNLSGTYSWATTWPMPLCPRLAAWPCSLAGPRQQLLGARGQGGDVFSAHTWGPFLHYLYSLWPAGSEPR